MQSPPQCFACVIVGDATRLGALSALEPIVLWQQAQRRSTKKRGHSVVNKGRLFANIYLFCLIDLRPPAVSESAKRFALTRTQFTFSSIYPRECGNNK